MAAPAESMLLRLHTVGVAHVLSDDPPPPGVKEEDGEAARRRKWARDDAVCRGHILAALSDGIFPDYVRHGTARAAWDALLPCRAPTIDNVFDGGATLLEQIAHVEALNAAMRLTLSDVELAETLCHTMLPAKVAAVATTIRSSADGGATMRDVWHVARIMEAQRIRREVEELHGQCRKCGTSRYCGCNCLR